MPDRSLTVTARLLGPAYNNRIAVADLEDIQQRMRADWDTRARIDASYYVAFGRPGQDYEEFLSTAGDILFTLREEYRRFAPGTDTRRLTALEVGCGPGRLLVPLSEDFGEIHGVDVSGGMVELARKNLAAVPHAHVGQNSGSDLSAFGDQSIDFCYSFAVFQHIPESQVVWSYLREICRVLKTGGLMKVQVNGLPQGRSPEPPRPPISGWSVRAGALTAPLSRTRHIEPNTWEPNTWSGVSFSPEEIAAFCTDNNLQLLAMDRFDTQYLWITARERAVGWRAQPPGEPARIVRVTDTFTADAVVPRSGRFASASVWVLDLSEDADLNRLRVLIGGEPVAPCFIGKHTRKNPTQVNVYLPPDLRSGIVPVQLSWLGEPISNTATMRVIGPGPLVPRVVTVTDAVNLMSNVTIENRLIKVTVEEVNLENEDEVREAAGATIGGRPAGPLEVYCLDPLPRVFEIDVPVPPDVPPGAHHLTLQIAGRAFAPIPIEVQEQRKAG